MNATYFHDAAELPPGVPLLIYGAGGRGQTLAGAIQAAGANRLLGFADSFKAGECMDLPVRRLDDLSGFLARPVAARASNVAVKYIVTADNASEGEIAAFVRRCQREGVRRVIISRDFYREDVPEREREALRSLAGRLSGAGIEYNFLGTAVPEGLG